MNLWIIESLEKCRFIPQATIHKIESQDSYSWVSVSVYLGRKYKAWAENTRLEYGEAIIVLTDEELQVCTIGVFSQLVHHHSTSFEQLVLLSIGITIQHLLRMDRGYLAKAQATNKGIALELRNILLIITFVQ
ncbi:hypothetical protein L6452_19653 [Arctium lappa]|uniref:Uncharacterized protein n=1 Tax=Arctium lappa TaxID=4217 RepID=A0ACB9B8E3_ARCLA|nr:hypothetical protein L6452_19653 [Arctium lappa]